MNTLTQRDRCHYCGEQIDEGTTRCPHCGHWLVAREQQPEEEACAEQQNEHEETGKPTGRHRGCLTYFLIILILVIVAFVTNPSKREHKEEIRSSIIEVVRDYADDKLQQKDAFTSLLGSVMLSSDFLVQTIMNQFLTIDIDNYGLFSLGYIKAKENNKSKLISIAAFGKVFMLTDFTDLQKQINESGEGSQASDAD